MMTLLCDRKDTLGVIAAALLWTAAAAHAQTGPNDLRASLLAGTDYVRHGLSQNDQAPALRVAFDFEHKSGLFFGGSLGNVEYAAESRFRKPRDTELRAYAGYLWRKNQWMTNVTFARYVYPDIEQSYEYNEAAVNLSYRDRYFLSVSRGEEYLGVLDSSTRVRVGLALPWIRDLEFGANLGKSRIDARADIDYTYWDIGLSRALGRFAFDLRFHDSTAARSSLAGNDTDNRWVFSMTYALVPFD